MERSDNHPEAAASVKQGLCCACGRITFGAHDCAKAHFNPDAKAISDFEEAWRINAASQCQHCPQGGEMDGKRVCRLSPTRPCDIGYHQRKGRGCFDDPPRYLPLHIEDLKTVEQPSLDDHCVAVTALSRLPHHRERQTICLDSWRRFGLSIIAVNRASEIEELRSVYPQVATWIVQDSPQGEYAWHTQKIKDLANVAVRHKRTVLLINSDIEIYGDQRLIIEPLSRGEQIVGIRWNYAEDDYSDATRELWGLDAFSFTQELAESLPDLPLRIGRPVWDYWIPLHSRSVKQRMKFIGERLFFHRSHDVHWSQNDWNVGAKYVTDHYEVNFGSFGDGLGMQFRNSLPYPPHPNSSGRQPRPIAILTSPRTGSNLLVDSLATHPHAKSASEWFGRWVTPDAARNREKGIDYCNVFKLFSAEQDRKGFDEIVAKCFCVYLFRRDRDAQLESWRRACETGWFVNEIQGHPLSFPADAEEQIERAEKQLRPRAEMEICYEDMVANWKPTIARLLRAANWPVIPLEQARSKIGSDSSLRLHRSTVG